MTDKNVLLFKGRLKILIVEDDPGDLLLTKSILRKNTDFQADITSAKTYLDASNILQNEPPDIVLLDLSLPDSQGLSTFTRLYKEAQNIPVIIMSGLSDETIATEAVKQGAQDYLVKGEYNTRFLSRSIRYAIERKQIKIKLEERERQATVLIEKNKDGIVLVNRSGRIIFANPSALKLYGRSSEELIGSQFGLFAIDSHSAEMELQRNGSDTIIVEMNTAEIVIEGEAVWLYSLRDISERKKTQLQLEQTNRELLEAKSKIIEQQSALIEEERLKVVLQMAGAAAHELNQPLMMLLGNIELMELDEFRPESVKELAPKIKKTAQRLSDTVKKIQTIDQYKIRKHDSNSDIIDINTEIRILFVEKDDDDYDLIDSFFSETNRFKLYREKTMRAALSKLETHSFDLIFLDYGLPDGTGADLLKQMKRMQIPTPVICITSHGSEATAIELFRLGAYDYLSKYDLDYDKLITSIDVCLEKYRLKNDINNAMKKMASLATHDELTGLYNRRYMNEILENEFKRALRYGTNLSCILFDLDYFKQVNDNFGHACGDKVLTMFAERIIENKRQSDYAFRYGGEEFLLLLPQTDIQGAMIAAKNILLQSREKEYFFENRSFLVTVSMGIAEIKECPVKQAKDLIAHADKSLYRAKADGRNCIRVFQPEERECIPAELFKGGKGLLYFKEELSQLLERSKKAATTSLESLVRNVGGLQFEEETRRTQSIISFLCKRFHFPESIMSSIHHAVSLNNGFKMILGEEILLKAGKLTQEDKEKIRNLPYLQIELANQFNFFSEEKEVLQYHNEWYDGSGYPEGLKKEEIPLGARIFSVVEALVSMTSERPYRNRLSDEQAVAELVRNAGTQFDPSLVNILLEIIEENGLADIQSGFILNQKNKLEDKLS